MRSRRWMAAATVYGVAAFPAQAMIDGPVDGFGTDLPLSVVAQQIVPPSISVAFGPGVNQQQVVTWRGGPSWQGTLRDAISPLGLTAAFDENRVTVEAPAPPQVPPWLRPDHWAAEPGQDLAQVVRLWSARVGVTPVIHGIYRYPIESRLAFDTDYQDAISRLVESFSTAEPRPLLDIWADGDNYTVEITQGAGL